MGYILKFVFVYTNNGGDQQLIVCRQSDVASDTNTVINEYVLLQLTVMLLSSLPWTEKCLGRDEPRTSCVFLWLATADQAGTSRKSFAGTCWQTWTVANDSKGQQGGHVCMARNVWRCTGTLSGGAVLLAHSKTTVGGWQVVKGFCVHEA